MLKGGSPLSNDESVFSFELNEALFFEKGQEVAEMRGISLEPEISVQTFNDYISIVGSIELRGEFEKILSMEEEPITDFTDYHAKRYIEKVVDTENNAATFSHQFPVEISVPTYRVSDINDITVNIDAFDYEVPDPSQLKLYSTIEIHGINSEIEAPPVRGKTEETALQMEQEEVSSVDQLQEEEKLEEKDKEREPEKQELEVQDTLQERDETKSMEVGDTFQFEMKEKQEKEFADEAELLNTDHPPALPVEAETVTKDEGEDVEADPDRWKYKESKTLAEFFNKTPAQEPEEEASETPEDLPTPEPETSDEADLIVADEADPERVEGVTYLSDMFRDTEENQYTKMRLCIVQDQDTIESIAERYHISALQLIKQNHLDEDYNIAAGQLLYIPMQREK